MFATKQLRVLDQTFVPAPNESCGYHCFKNVLLSLLFIEKSISSDLFNHLLEDPSFYNALFDMTVAQVNDSGNIDVTLPRFIELIQQASKGQFDLAHFGITKEILMSLNLDNLSVANFFTFSEMCEYGLGGSEEDLLVASNIAQLAKTEGKAAHVFALGIDNTHWVNLILKQDDKGSKSWKFMDSWKNQSRFMRSVTLKIEEILLKEEHELEKYLLQAYENSSNLFLRRYHLFFDFETGIPYPERIGGFGVNEDEEKNAFEFFIEDKPNLEQFLTWIENRYQFMQQVGWLISSEDETIYYVKQLYHLTHFLIDNLSIESTDFSRLAPIHFKLESVIKKLNECHTDEYETLESSSDSEEERINLQTKETLKTLRLDQPQPMIIENEEPKRSCCICM